MDSVDFFFLINMDCIIYFFFFRRNFIIYIIMDFEWIIYVKLGQFFKNIFNMMEPTIRPTI